MLTGMAYLQVNQPFKCKKVMLDVESEEKAEFTRFWTTQKTVDQEDGTQRIENEHHEEQVDEKHDGFEFKSKLFDCKKYGNMFQVGNYAFQFQFKLPKVLPSSFKFKDKHDKAKPEAKVVHEIKIKLKGTDFKDSPDFKVEFKVRNDKCLETGKKLDKKKTDELACYFCIPKGKLHMAADFDKEFFYKDDTPDCKVSCDASESQMEVVGITYKVMQYTTIRIKKHAWHGQRVLVQKRYPGLAIGDKRTFDAEVDLAKIKKDILPSCKVHLIENVHRQRIDYVVEGCCTPIPNIEMPMVIAKSKPKKFKGFVPPSGMEPQVLGNFTLKVPDYKHAK